MGILSLLRIRLGKRTALRGGYGVIIAMLVISSVEAYRIQGELSARHVEAYRRYMEKEEALVLLRRNIWLAGNHVRDFFIRTNAEQAALLKSQIEKLWVENDEALALLKKPGGLHAAVPASIASAIAAYRAALEPVPATMLRSTGEEQYQFLQREVSPRRRFVHDALRDLSAGGQRALEASESRYAASRRAAGRRLLLMLSICVLLGLLVARLSLTHAERLERETARHYADLQHLSARLLEVEEEGRKRLSRELHDEIGQSLAVLQIEISKAQAQVGGPPESLRAHLKRAHGLVERTVQTIRNISLLLRPALLDDLGLVPALQFQLEDFMERTGLSCEFAEDGVRDDLPDSVKTCVYRVVQEALHNCEKHALAATVRVSVRQTGELLTAEIQDDGRGFELNRENDNAIRSGLGIVGMRERASMVGGSLALDSRPGSGTRVRLRIPLSAVGPRLALQMEGTA